MPYLLEYMSSDDIADVARIERLCFSMPWPTSAYRRELKTPETNRYLVVRWVSPALAEQLGIEPPSEANLTVLDHPELEVLRPQPQPQQRAEPSLLARLTSFLHWGKGDEGAHQAGGEPGGTLDDATSGRPDFETVGYAGLWLMVDEAHVTTIGVHPSHRGHGAGELLFLGLADIALEMGAHRITLEVRVSNLGAQALYRKYGLEVAGVRRRYYSDNGEDAYIMWSEPVKSREFRERIARLRAGLTARLRAEFRRQTPPAHAVDATRLQ